jgi:arginine utilization protein RocB
VATPGVLQDAIATVVQAHPEARLVQHEYFPYLSDLSYLRLDAGMDLTVLKANMPVWHDRISGAPSRPGSYYLPLETIQQLNIPVANFGVHGRGAHQRDECVSMSYSFGTLPQLLYETIEYIGNHSENW